MLVDALFGMTVWSLLSAGDPEQRARPGAPTSCATPGLVDVYGVPGTTIDIPTSAGTAKAYVLPAPPAQLGLVDLILKAVIGVVGSTDFATCAATDQSTAAATGVSAKCSAARL